MIIAYCYGLCAVGSPQSVVQSSQVGASGLTLPTGQQAENQFCICEVIAGDSWCSVLAHCPAERAVLELE